MKALELISTLEAQAAEIASQSLNGWGNTMTLAAAELRRLAAVEAERDELRATEAAWRKLNDTLLHQVLCCGVAASHPDAALTTRGAYAGRWNSKQAEAVRALRADRDSLRAELERIKALKPTFWFRPRSDGCYEGPIHNARIEAVRKESGGWVALYALGSKTND